MLSPVDSFESHINDTLNAGAGLCDKRIVEKVVRDGPAMIDELIELGVQFSTRENGNIKELNLGREGGHSKRRIVHAKDITGRVIEQALLDAVANAPNITLYEDFIAVDLFTHSKFVGPAGKEAAWGCYALDKRKGIVHTFLSRITVIATGGAGKVYVYTSNPNIATGDGIAIAYRAGAQIANMEFMQFHPTCLYHPEAKNFLITEALRGEGAVLKLSDSTRFMKAHHEKAELAPRDIVARAIDFELKKSGDECVYLDISHKEPEFVKERFPNIYKKCLDYGIDITKEPIPVVPAAHYICGGIKTDEHGKSSIERLYAIGEAASTGLHGANRLASNSLLEALVMANSAATSAGKELGENSAVLPSIPEWETRGAVTSDEAGVISQNWDEVRRFMWNYVGIVRSNKRLERARRRITLLESEINEYYWDFRITADCLELRNIATVAKLIITCAESRCESRGLHYNIDYPEKNDKEFLKETVIELKTPAQTKERL